MPAFTCVGPETGLCEAGNGVRLTQFALRRHSCGQAFDQGFGKRPVSILNFDSSLKAVEARVARTRQRESR